MQEFLVYGVFDPLFFSAPSQPVSFFFLTTKKKAKKWAQRIGLCSKSEFTYLRARCASMSDKLFFSWPNFEVKNGLTLIKCAP